MRFVSKMSSVLLVGKVAAYRLLTKIATPVVCNSLWYVTFAMFLVGWYALLVGDNLEGFRFYGDVATLTMIIAFLLENWGLRAELARHTRPQTAVLALDPSVTSKKDNVIPFPTKGGDLNA